MSGRQLRPVLAGSRWPGSLCQQASWAWREGSAQTDVHVLGGASTAFPSGTCTAGKEEFVWLVMAVGAETRSRGSTWAREVTRENHE